MHNHITIYSSGIADIQRGYSIPTGEATKIALLINRDHLGDVLGSLNIYGPVTLVSPPVYAPQNEAAGNLDLKGDGVLEDLAVKLRGAKVQLKRAGDTVAGTLLGVQQESEWQEKTLLAVKYLIVLTSGGVARVAFRDIQRWQFVDEVVNKELEKALTRQFRKLKPDSTTIDLTLSASTPDAEAVVQYTVPAAAWKISYRLREQEEGKYEFQGFAIVDNHSEEDWNDVMIAVVTGEPITFSTDLAITKVPSRDHVNLVKAKALGAKEVEEAMEDMVMMAAPTAGGAAPLAARAKQRSVARDRISAEMSDMRSDASFGFQMPSPAYMEPAETREVGDFAIFRAQTPVSIGAHRSALVPIFLVALDHTRSVLYYKQADHAERGYRALEFTNTTSYSLGRGVCSVYAEDTFMGSCVLPATSPGGDALLVHALETGVRVQTELKTQQSEIIGIKVSAGASVVRKRSTTHTHYQFASLKEEPFTVVIDHDFRAYGPQVTAVVRRTSGETPLEIDSKLKSGVRMRLALGALERLDVIVTETRIDSERIALVESKNKAEQLNTAWLVDHLMVRNGPLAAEPALRAALEIEKRLSAKAEEIAEITQRVLLLNQRQERLRKNIASGGQDEQTARWRVELGEAEVQINQREEQTLPQLRAEEQAIRAELRQALLNLVLEWKE